MIRRLTLNGSASYADRSHRYLFVTEEIFYDHMHHSKSVVVGTGFIGPIHVEALRRCGVQVMGIIGSTPEKSLSASRDLGLPTRLTSLSQVLEDPEIDCVHLTTPNALHFPQAKAVIEAGKHVLCEKPLAVSSDESAQLVQLAKQAKVAAGVAYNIRFYPLCQESAARVQDGTLGNVIHVQGSYVQDWLLYPEDYNWRVSAKEGGPLRAVADIGTHWLDLIQFITGKKVSKVLADLHTVYPTRQRPVGGAETFSGSNTQRETEPVEVSTDDCGSVLLKFEDGTPGNLWVSQTTAGRKNCLRFEIAGSEQALSFNSETPNELWIGHRNQANQALLRDPSLLSTQAASKSSYPGGHNEGFPDAFKQLFRAFYQYIEDGDYSAPTNFPSFADGHRDVSLCEAILTSHQEQRWVEVSH